MGIKEEVFNLVTDYRVWGMQKASLVGEELKEADKCTDKLIAIFDKEKKDFALECCKEMIDLLDTTYNITDTDYKEDILKKHFPSHLTATKLEGEK